MTSMALQEDVTGKSLCQSHLANFGAKQQKTQNPTWEHGPGFRSTDPSENTSPSISQGPPYSRTMQATGQLRHTARQKNKLWGGTVAVTVAMSLFIGSACAQRNISVSAQGAQFCSTLIANLNQCPVDIPTVDTVNLNRYSGKWYAIGTNAQNAFSLFGLQTAQCVTSTYDLFGRRKGANVMRIRNKGIVLTNPLRNIESMIVSQDAQSVALGVRFLCQFVVGEEPLSDVVPQLKTISRSASKVTYVDRLRREYSSKYTKSVQFMIKTDPVLQQIADQAGENATRQATSSILGRTTVLGNPAMMGSLQLLGSYANVSQTALDTTVTVKGMSNAVSFATIFSSLRAKAKERLSKFAGAVSQSVESTSMFSEQIFNALERVQVANLALSSGPSPDDVVARRSVFKIYQEFMRIKWLVRRLSADRRRMNLSGWRMFVRLNSTDPALALAAQAIMSISSAEGPMAAAIKHISIASDDAIKTVRSMSPPLPLPRTVRMAGVGIQNPNKRGSMVVTFGPNFSPYNILKLQGPAWKGYTLALVWGCSKGFESGFLPENEVYLLARQRSLPPQVINNALAYLKAKGIMLLGHNAFLRLNQDSVTCKPKFSI